MLEVVNLLVSIDFVTFSMDYFLFPNHASVPANSNWRSRLRPRKYSKCMNTWHETSTSGWLSFRADDALSFHDRQLEK